ncbi:YihY/virulence factor BrkB family protein [uncultured Parabacteroides sp.]|uniref:YihY/virulence factor BrkB family protein n=1 Tax=uncultured Parabacteroides sp. TaxID=512312 RepID=UPI0025FDE30C|nr:YihY/virulence factor BrkB family protein [uncultured Parabacteroides sp.]MCD7851156.1 YihY/virulence factor BrkB family protein [Parabacteroides sp.]
MNSLSKSKKKLTISLLFKIVKDMIQGFMNDSVPRLSASLAYATLFSTIPLLSLLITLGVFFHMDLTGQLYIQLEPILGTDVVQTLRTIIENAADSDSSTFATVVSLGVSIFGATTIFAEIQSSLNTIWGIKAVPKKSWLKYLKNRLLSFSIILVFAFILLITFTISNIIENLSDRFINNYPDVAESLVKIVGLILNIGVTTIIFMLIFKILPDAKIKSKDIFIGATVTTILLLIGQWGISLYISIANVGTVYGAAAFMAVFITWIYYSAIIIYTGAEFTKAWANEMGGKIFPDEYAVATKIIEIQKDGPIG